MTGSKNKINRLQKIESNDFSDEQNKIKKSVFSQQKYGLL